MKYGIVVLILDDKSKLYTDRSIFDSYIKNLCNDDSTIIVFSAKSALKIVNPGTYYKYLTDIILSDQADYEPFDAKMIKKPIELVQRQRLADELNENNVVIIYDINKQLHYDISHWLKNCKEYEICEYESKRTYEGSKIYDKVETRFVADGERPLSINVVASKNGTVIQTNYQDGKIVFKHANYISQKPSNGNKKNLTKVIIFIIIAAFICGIVGLIRVLVRDISSNSSKKSSAFDVEANLNQDENLTTYSIEQSLPVTEEITDDIIETSVSSSEEVPTKEAVVDSYEDSLYINNNSANIVNGGHAIYDNESHTYFYGGKELRIESPKGVISTVYNKTSYYLQCDNTYVYFCSDDGVYRMDLHSKAVNKLIHGSVHELTLYKNKLYFCGDIGQGYYIYSCDCGGMHLKDLAQVNEWYMSIYDDRIYYTDYDNGRKLYSMNLDGGDITLVSGKKVFDVCIYNNTLYYSDGSDSRSLYKMNMDGSNITKIIDGECRHINIFGDKLYFVMSDGNIYRLSIDGKSKEIVKASGNCSYICIVYKKLVWCDKYNDYNVVIDNID